MLNVALVVIGLIADIASLLAWTGITPETFGESAYQVLRVALPIIASLFGAVLGWGLRGLCKDIRMQLDANASAEAEAKLPPPSKRVQKRIITHKLEGLTLGELNLVRTLFGGGHCAALEGDTSTQPLVTTGIVMVRSDGDDEETILTPDFRALCMGNEAHVNAETKRLMQYHFKKLKQHLPLNE